MSSAYLDYQPYAAAIETERADLERFLDDLLDSWLTLALDPAAGIFPRRAAPKFYPHAWFWGRVGEHADPNKVASAQETRLRCNLTTLSAEYADRGQDWEQQLRQRARERALQAELGLPDASAAPAGGAPQLPGPPDGGDDE